jgi:hypothetical protein
MVSTYFHLFYQQWWNCVVHECSAYITSPICIRVSFKLHYYNTIMQFTFNKILVLVAELCDAWQITGMMFLCRKEQYYYLAHVVSCCYMIRLFCSPQTFGERKIEISARLLEKQAFRGEGADIVTFWGLGLPETRRQSHQWKSLDHQPPTKDWMSKSKAKTILICFLTW